MGGCKIRLGFQTIPYKSISNAANELCGISLRQSRTKKEQQKG